VLADASENVKQVNIGGDLFEPTSHAELIVEIEPAQ